MYRLFRQLMMAICVAGVLASLFAHWLIYVPVIGDFNEYEIVAVLMFAAGVGGLIQIGHHLFKGRPLSAFIIFFVDMIVLILGLMLVGFATTFGHELFVSLGLLEPGYVNMRPLTGPITWFYASLFLASLPMFFDWESKSFQVDS
ncbi:MAG: hypothetical protein ABA06_00620 [Parcubacteria bacterium C7867-001]|nr:MAG: hypothetical protein ABA06_00620 [Parcubacteria bacterium C7867-001]